MIRKGTEIIYIYHSELQIYSYHLGGRARIESRIMVDLHEVTANLVRYYYYYCRLSVTVEPESIAAV